MESAAEHEAKISFYSVLVLDMSLRRYFRGVGVVRRGDPACSCKERMDIFELAIGQRDSVFPIGSCAGLVPQPHGHLPRRFSTTASIAPIIDEAASIILLSFLRH